MEEIVMRNADISSNQYIVLSRIVMATIPYPSRSHCYITFLIESDGFIEYDHAKASGFVRLDRSLKLGVLIYLPLAWRCVAIL